MSRIGKKPIIIPNEVDVKLEDTKISVKGPLGQLELQIHHGIIIERHDQELKVLPRNENDRQDKALWGLFRTLINNMILGVTSGFEKKLEVIGIGYKVAMKGSDLLLNVGYSHPVEFKMPVGVKAEVSANVIIVKGIDKFLVGETAAQIRRIRKPEPYKGKGIKYVDEVIRRKAGKVAKGAEK